MSGSELQTVGAEIAKARQAEFEERPASVRGLSAVVEKGRVVRTVTEGTPVSMSILHCSIQLPLRLFKPQTVAETEVQSFY